MSDACIHCGLCKEHCDFLKKYDLTIGDRDKLDALKYHCFLCGGCKTVCPVDIDGAEVVLALRTEGIRQNGGRPENLSDYPALLKKRNLLYRNNRHAKGESLVFFGCNFPAFYPKTTKYLVELFKEKGIPYSFDCCGKPLHDLGLMEDADFVIKRLENLIRKKGIREVIMVCPNCYYFLRDKVSVPVTTIYEKLGQMGIGLFGLSSGQFFLPCPDREEKKILQDIEGLSNTSLKELPFSMCCGLGGSAYSKERDLATGFAKQIKNLKGEDPLYVYCASCGGNLSRQGIRDVRHVLSELLGVCEAADFSHQTGNRMKMKWS